MSSSMFWIRSALGRSVSGSFLGFFRLTSRLRKPQMPMLPQSAFSKASQAQVRTVGSPALCSAP
ncbi:unnamed protein product [Symbiodinium necroappetens]|uniref:Uncharacterized protein n=1 Tax=Symbiodinium necroappetens TaxID=1628268 RepID=A0A812JW05_9DINO|nr:unnamed protein product [Symbiodinium necroappetens]